LREYVPDDSLYDETFDWFEYLFGLAHSDLTTTPEELAKLKAGPEGWNIWGPVGRFVWKDDYGGTSIIAMSEWPTGQSLPVHVAAALRAGFFGAGGPMDERYRNIKHGFDSHIDQVRLKWRVF